MWHFGSKRQKIGALVKASYKWLKTVLALEVRNFDLAFIVLKLVKFPLFNNFFLDLANFQDLKFFLLFNFSDLDNFLVFNNILDFSINSSLPSMLPILFVINTYNNIIIYSIDINNAAILLKL